MNNERQIKPLREYTVSWLDIYGERPDRTETFTADSYFQDENSLIFHNTGNVVRQYFHPIPSKVQVTPVDEAQIPQ